MRNTLFIIPAKFADHLARIITTNFNSGQIICKFGWNYKQGISLNSSIKFSDHVIYINLYTHYCYIYHYCSLISIKNFYLKMKHIINHAKSHDLKNFWEAVYLSDDTDTPIWILSNNYSFISQNIKNLASVIILTSWPNC